MYQTSLLIIHADAHIKDIYVYVLFSCVYLDQMVYQTYCIANAQYSTTY